MVQNASVIPGGGLQGAVAVYKKSIAFRVQPHRSNQLIYRVSIDSGPQNPGFPAFDFSLHSHCDMRKPAKTHEDIADVGTPRSNLIEPGLLAVVAALEIVGSHIADLHAVFIYHAQIYKPAELLLHDAKYALEVSLVSQFLKGMLGTDKTYGRKSFGKEHLHGMLALVHQDEQRVNDLLPERVLVLVRVYHRHGKKRNNRDHDHQDNDPSAKQAVNFRGPAFIGKLEQPQILKPTRQRHLKPSLLLKVCPRT